MLVEGEITKSISKVKLTHTPKLRRFLKGENFAQFCERFKEFAYLSKLQDDKLHLYFLQHVDDETYSTLKSVSLSPREQADPELFCDEFKRAVYGEESTTLKAEVLDCKQLSSESVEEYAYRLREKAVVAFSDIELANQNCLISFVKGVRDPYIGRKLNEEELHDFNEAVKLAKRLEVIERMYGNQKSQDASILKETHVSFSPRDVSEDNRERRSHSRTPSRSRERYDRSRSSSRSISRERYPRSHSSFHRSRNDSVNSRNSDRSFSSRSRSNPRSSHQRSRSRSLSRQRYIPSGRNQPRKRCWHCNRIGHVRRHCWYLSSQYNSPFQRSTTSNQPFNHTSGNESYNETQNTNLNGSNRRTHLN